MCSKQAGSAFQLSKLLFVIQIKQEALFSLSITNNYYTANSIKLFFSLLFINYIKLLRTAAFSLHITNYQTNIVMKHRLLKGSIAQRIINTSNKIYTYY